jgi:hypothetical protein
MVLAVAGAIAVLLSALATWSRSGSVARNAFELADAADDLGEVRSSVARVALLVWFAIPMLVAAAWLAATFVRPYLVAAFAGTVAVMAVLAGAAVLVSPLRTGAGPWLAIPAGAVTLLMVGRILTEQRQ